MSIDSWVCLTKRFDSFLSPFYWTWPPAFTLYVNIDSFSENEKLRDTNLMKENPFCLCCSVQIKSLLIRLTPCTPAFKKHSTLFKWIFSCISDYTLFSPACGKVEQLHKEGRTLFYHWCRLLQKAILHTAAPFYPTDITSLQGPFLKSFLKSA